MRYKTISIEPNLGTDKWNVYIYLREGDRVNKKTSPHPLGFFHFPENMDENIAAKKLIKCMITRHNEEIERLERSRNSLFKLSEKY